MSIPYYPASSGHQQQTQHGFPSSPSPSQGNIHTASGGNSQAANGGGGPTSPLRSGAFFERHNIFGRSRSSLSSAAAASVPSLRSDSPDLNQAGYSPVEPASPTTRRSAFRPGLLTRHSSSSTSRIPLEQVRSNSSSNNDRVGFPSSRPSTSFRVPQDEQDMSGSNGPRMAGSNQMVRTESSGGTGSSSNPFGRMFRRYSQGQGVHARTSSNASDAPPQLGRTVTPTGTNARTGSGGRNPPTLDVGSNGDAVPAAIVSAAPERSLSDQASDAVTNGPPASAPAATTSTTTASSSAFQGSGTNPSLQAGVHRLRLVPHLEATRSLHFEPIERDVRESATPVKIGRFTDRAPAAAIASADDAASSRPVGSTAPSGSAPGNRGGAVPTTAGGGGRIDSTRIAFKSKVVSRGHAEIWCEAGGRFCIRDTKSSSGTFLNHIRLAGANVESKPFPIKDGDILQLGVDYQGGTEEIYRCVKIRVELNRGWQREANQFNVNALRQLRALQGSPIQATVSSKAAVTSPGAGELPTNRQSMNVTDCCICLFSVTVCQALFIAPCSHVFHYKCIRPLLSSHYPGFSCPLCRTFADLEADVEEDEAWQEALLKEAQAGEAGKAQGPSTPMVELPSSVGSSGQSAESPFVPSTASNQREGASSVPTQPSVPFTSSRLRQQVHQDASSTGGHEGPQRPGTAIADTAFSEDQYDGTMVFPEGARRPRPSRGSNSDGEEEDDEDGEEVDEEEEEMLLDDRTGFGADVMHEIDRISEEVDRSGSSSFARNSGSPRGVQARRGSQPISIQGVEGGRFTAGQTAASIGFSPLEEARTPVNQHVLSVLAEAPPPSSAAARRLAAQRQQQSAGAAGMPSLGGASSDLLDVGAPFSGPRGSDAGSRRGSNVSEDVGYLTPAEGSHDGHGGIEGSSGMHRSASGAARTSPSASRRSLGSGSPREQRQDRGAAASASTSSNRASPSTAGDMEVDDDVDEEDDDDYAMVDATSGPRGAEPQGSRRGSAMGSSTKGKSRKRETSANGSFDSQGSHNQQQQQQQQRHGQASPTPLQGGTAKVKAMFRRASGGGGAA